jgi:hypothetical protein
VATNQNLGRHARRSPGSPPPPDTPFDSQSLPARPFPTRSRRQDHGTNGLDPRNSARSQHLVSRFSFQRRRKRTDPRIVNGRVFSPPPSGRRPHLRQAARFRPLALFCSTVCVLKRDGILLQWPRNRVWGLHPISLPGRGVHFALLDVRCWMSSALPAPVPPVLHQSAIASGVGIGDSEDECYVRYRNLTCRRNTLRC